MPGEAIVAHLTARMDYEHSKAELEKVADLLATAAKALRNSPSHLTFANIPMFLPAEASQARHSVCLDANEWKSAEEIMVMLTRFHVARDQIRSTWLKIPAELRSGLRAPPDRIVP